VGLEAITECGWLNDLERPLIQYPLTCEDRFTRMSQPRIHPKTSSRAFLSLGRLIVFDATERLDGFE
jgi:hypothetical protein